MNYPTNDRIGRAINILTTGLQPFVTARMEARYGKEWRKQASTSNPRPRAFTKWRSALAAAATAEMFGFLVVVIDNP